MEIEESYLATFVACFPNSYIAMKETAIISHEQLTWGYISARCPNLAAAVISLKMSTTSETVPPENQMQEP